MPHPLEEEWLLPANLWMSPERKDMKGENAGFAKGQWIRVLSLVARPSARSLCAPFSASCVTAKGAVLQMQASPL
jgi:hypothetical protein